MRQGFFQLLPKMGGQNEIVWITGGWEAHICGKLGDPGACSPGKF